LHEALALALGALRKESCLSVFNTNFVPGSNVHGLAVDPADVLVQMYVGTRYGRITWDNLPSAYAEMRYEGPNGSTWTRANVVLDIRRAMNGPVSELADTLLHELGHVFNEIRLCARI
jgi:hypothetical protein